MQTTYNEAMAVGVAGEPVDCTNRRIDSKYAEETISAGQAVQVGTSGDQCVVSTDAVYGVAVQHPTLTIDGDTGLAQYSEGDGVSILRAGRIWVEVDEAVSIDAAAYWDPASGAFNASATDNVAVTGGRFVSSTSGAGLAILEIV